MLHTLQLVLALAAVLAKASAAEAGESRRALADNIPPCAYFPDGGSGLTASSCGLNPKWLATQKPVGSGARAEALIRQYVDNCAKHNVTSGSPQDVDECAADTENYCYVDGRPGSWFCRSVGATAAAYDAGTYCKGSLWEDYIACQSLDETACETPPADPTLTRCVWRADLAANPALFKSNRAAIGSGYQMYGYCIPVSLNKTIARAAVPTSTTWNNLGPILSPLNDSAAYAKVRGTCDVAIQGFKRANYEALCNPLGQFSTKMDGQWAGLMLGTGNFAFGNYLNGTKAYNLTGVDQHVAMKCLMAGCDIHWYPSSATWTFHQQDFFSCGPDLNTRNSLGIYDPVKDKQFLTAIRVCWTGRRRFNKDLCESATLDD